MRSRDVAFGALALLLLALTMMREASEFLRQAQAKRDALLLYDNIPREQSAHARARLCLRGMGVPRDTLGAAAFAPLPPHTPVMPLNVEGDGLLPGLTRGQFRRLPRVGARGMADGQLRFGLFTPANFSGDFIMSRAKYGRRTPGAPLLLPRPMRACAAATPADIAALPEGCDAAAARTGRAQGYSHLGVVSAELLSALPDRDPLRLFPRWTSCALVGAHAARGAPGAGGAIDAAQTVIRVGGVAAAPESVAGTRTTVRVLGPRASAALVAGGTDRDAELLHGGSQRVKKAVQLHLLTEPAALNATLRWQHANPFADMAIADQDFHQLALDAHGGRAPPAAFFALLLAAVRCEHVTLFGFTCNAEEREEPHADDYANDGGDALGSDADWSAEEAAAAVRAEERTWRIFLQRWGSQFAFAREAA